MGEGGRRETLVKRRRTQDSDWRKGEMREGGRRETGDKRMGCSLYIVEGGSRKRETEGERRKETRKEG